MAIILKTDPARMKDLMAFRKSLSDRAIKEQRDLSVAEQAQFDVWGAELETLTEGRKTSPEAPGATYTTSGEATGETAGFSNIGEMMQALFRRSRGDGLDERLETCRQYAINTGIGSEGGFGVPTGFIVTALDVSPMEFPLLGSCNRVPMTTGKAMVPLFADNSHSSTAPYGITWRTIPEGGTFGDPQNVPMRALDVQATKHGAYFAVCNEWLSDADIGIQRKLETIFTTSLQWYVENKLWTGTGGGEPVGALGGTGSVSVAKESGQAADTLAVQNIDKMWSRLRPGSHNRAIWVANQTCYPQLAGLTRVVGTSGVPVMQPNLKEGPPEMINGRPLYLSEHLPVLGDAGDICLLDPTLYVLGDRQQVMIDVSPHVLHQQDKTAFRVSARFTGMPALPTALTPKNGDDCGWLTKVSAR